MTKVFDKLKFNNVYELLKLIHSNELYSTAISIYETYHTGRGSTEKFITEIELIYSSGNERKLSDSLINTDGDLISENGIKKLLLEIMLTTNNKYSECVADYFELFKSEDGKYVYTPNKENRLKQSGVRNFIYELGLVELQKNNQTYQLNCDKALIYVEYASTFTLNPKVLCILQQIKKEIGDKAELRIMDYERKRIKNSNNLLSLLKHVALTDVNAGYDILSWEITPITSKRKPRYIEVKAVPLDNMRFYWSSHEIEVAIQLGENYCLYLLPRVNEKFLIEKLEIIRNPSVAMLMEKGWNSKIENYSIWR